MIDILRLTITADDSGSKHGTEFVLPEGTNTDEVVNFFISRSADTCANTIKMIIEQKAPRKLVIEYGVYQDATAGARMSQP